jgi:capsular polysaccharide transport system ATP-binding protein
MIMLEKAGKAYKNRKNGIQWVLRDLDARFPVGESHAILAPHGHGKTTLLNMMCGNDTLSEGEIHRAGRVSYPLGFRGNMSNRLTARQNLRFLTDVFGRNYAEALDFCAAFAELDKQLDLPLSNFPGQARGRFFAGALFSLGFDYVLVDDAIALGDQKFRRKCIRYLNDNKDKITVLMATSDPDYAARLCKSASVLHKGKLEFFETFEEARNAFTEINKIYV